MDNWPYLAGGYFVWTLLTRPSAVGVDVDVTDMVTIFVYEYQVQVKELEGDPWNRYDGYASAEIAGDVVTQLKAAEVPFYAIRWKKVRIK